MQSNWWIDSLLLIACVTQTILLYGFFSQPGAHRFRSIGAYSILQLNLHIALYLIRPTYPAYFWTYWIGAAALAVLRPWILIDAMRAIPCAEDIPRYLQTIVCGLATAAAIGSGYLAYRTTLKPAARIAITAFKLSGTINLGVAVFVFVLLMCFVGTRLGLVKPASTIIIGLLLQCFGSFAMSWLLTQGTRTARLQANLASSLAEIIPAGIWAYALLRQHSLRAVTTYDVERFERLFTLLPGLSIDQER